MRVTALPRTQCARFAQFTHTEMRSSILCVVRASYRLPAWSGDSPWGHGCAGAGVHGGTKTVIICRRGVVGSRWLLPLRSAVSVPCLSVLPCFRFRRFAA